MRTCTETWFCTSLSVLVVLLLLRAVLHYWCLLAVQCGSAVVACHDECACCVRCAAVCRVGKIVRLTDDIDTGGLLMGAGAVATQCSHCTPAVMLQSAPVWMLIGCSFCMPRSRAGQASGCHAATFSPRLLPMFDCLGFISRWLQYASKTV